MKRKLKRLKKRVRQLEQMHGIGTAAANGGYGRGGYSEPLTGELLIGEPLRLPNPVQVVFNVGMDGNMDQDLREAVLSILRQENDRVWSR